MSTEPSEPHMTNTDYRSPAQAPQPQRSPMLKLLQIVGLGAIVAFIGVGAFLLTSPQPAKRNGAKVMAYRNERPPASVKYVDGLVVTSLSREIRLMMKDRHERVIHVRAPDKPYIDIQHAQTHAALGQPVRLYYKRVGGKDCAVFMEDSPVAF